jgi:hypothetical protein
MLSFEAVGNEIVDAQLERLGGRVPEDLRRGRVPEDDLSGVRLRDDDRVPYALEQLADAHIPRFHDRERLARYCHRRTLGPTRFMAVRKS